MSNVSPPSKKAIAWERLPVSRAGGLGRFFLGFTILELLVATAVFLILVVVLASISNQAASVWSRNENKSDLREAARAAVSRMGAEMKQATLPIYKADQAGLQFVINPTNVTTNTAYGSNSVFWQAPIATSQTQGDLAIVGYFIRRGTDNGRPFSRLCRLFVNPDNSTYDIYNSDGTWLSDGLLNAKAPGTEASDFQGVFLDNVLGMWVTAYSASGTPYAPYDSRVAQILPARVEISLVILDKIAADRAASLPDATGSADAAIFVAKLPQEFKPHVQTVSINVTFPH